MSIDQARWVADGCEQIMATRDPYDPFKLAELILALRTAANKIGSGVNLGDAPTLLRHTIEVT